MRPPIYLCTLLCVPPFSSSTLLRVPLFACPPRYVPPHIHVHPVMCPGQWKGASCGFETVLQYSIVRWTLRKLGIALHGRTCKVRTTSSWLWQRYNDFMDRMMGNAH